MRLSGRWLKPPPAAGAEEELLVVQVEGRRHRFPPGPDDEREAELEPSRWMASFTVPEWAEPRRDGQAALWLGDAVIPVPPLHGSHGCAQPEAVPAPHPPATPPAESSSPAEAPAPAEASPPAARALRAGTAADAPRSGPLADLLLKETVAALHAELEQRTADGARMRGALADSQAELEARAATQAQLETTLGELRGELERLTEAVVDQRREFDERGDEVATLREQLAVVETSADRRAAEVASLRQDLADAQVSREAAVSEVAGLRTQLERLGSELAVSRERVDGESGDLSEANRLLADARALSDLLRGQRGGG